MAECLNVVNFDHKYNKNLTVYSGVSEWLFFLTLNEKIFSYITVRTIYIQWNDDDVHFVLGHHAQFNIYSASLQKQQSKGRNVPPFAHIILS